MITPILISWITIALISGISGFIVGRAVEIDTKKEVEVKPRKKKKKKQGYPPKCPTEDKNSFYNMSQAKKRAAFKSHKNLKLRAYKCMYCPYYHHTKSKDKLRMH